MIADPRHTLLAGLKAPGPAWKPEITWRTRARLRYWRFFYSCVFINGESWRAVARLTGPMSGISTPLRFAATRFVEKATAVPSLNMEPAMTAATPVTINPLIHKSTARTIGNVHSVLIQLYALDVRETAEQKMSPAMVVLARWIDEALEHAERKSQRSRPASITLNPTA